MGTRLQTASWRVLLIIVAAGLAPGASAQTPQPLPAGPLTLEQVLDLAEARSEAIAAARAGIRRAEGEQVRARSGRLPQLNASGGYDRALASEFEGLFDGGGPPCDPFTLNPGAALDARVGEIERAIDCGAVGSSPFGGGGQSDGEDSPDLPFGRENTWRLNLNFSQAVYTGGRLAAQAALAGAGRESAELALTTSRAQLLFDVTQAYYDAALSDRLVAIAEATLGQAEATFKQVQVSFEAGAQPEFELLRSRVARDSQRPFIIRQRANREIAMLRLKQLIDMPATERLELAASLGGTALEVPPVFAARLATTEQVLRTEPAAVELAQPARDVPLVQDRTALKEVAAVVHLREAVVKATRAERMPSISVSSSYGRVAYPSGAVPAFGDFRTNWSVGAIVQVPILTGGRQRGDEIVAQAELEQSQLQLEQTRKLADLDTRSAWAELVAASAVWQASAGTVEQAGRAYEIADVRYRAGISTQLELSDSRLLLQQAEATRAQAARDLQVARARMALLPDLPLSTGGAGSMAPQASPTSSGTGGTASPGSAVPQAPAAAGQPRSASAAPAPSQSAVRQ